MDNSNCSSVFTWVPKFTTDIQSHDRTFIFMTLPCHLKVAISVSVSCGFLNLPLVNSHKKMGTERIKPATNIIMIKPNCDSDRGWLCLTLGSGLRGGGLITLNLILFKTPVSLSQCISSCSKVWKMI